jgi:hypothetical protein
MSVIIPYWLLMLFTLTPAALLWRFRPRPPNAHLCPHCNYNLSGNTTGVCPECGKAVATKN